MKKSKKLNLDQFLFNVKDLPYAIIKLNGRFPNYFKGEDIDIFCYNKGDFGKKILEIGNDYLKQGFEIKVTDKTKTHTYIDFFLNNKLEFRFDLYQALPNYKKVRIKKHYFYSVIENAIAIKRNFKSIKYPIYVPSTVDDLLIRYIEYIEWYELKPGKIKHLDYITKAILSDSRRIGFLDKLHLYTELPDVSPKITKRKGREITYKIKQLGIKLKRLFNDNS